MLARSKEQGVGVGFLHFLGVVLSYCRPCPKIDGLFVRIPTPMLQESSAAPRRIVVIDCPRIKGVFDMCAMRQNVDIKVDRVARETGDRGAPGEEGERVRLEVVGFRGRS